MPDQILTKDMCCPEFNVKKWDGVMNEWNKKPFIKDNVFQLFHIPLNMGAVITKMYKKVQDAGASPENLDDFLILSYDPSPWKSELHMTVTKEVPNAEMTYLSGKFYSRVFDGPYNAVPQWIEKMEQELKEKGLKAERYYFHYAYCPKCAQKYGHNYCVAFAKVG